MGARHRGLTAITVGLTLVCSAPLFAACGGQQQHTEPAKTVTVTDHTEATTLLTTTTQPRHTGPVPYTAPTPTSGPTPTITTFVEAPTTSGPVPTTTTFIGTPTTTAPTIPPTPTPSTAIPTNSAPTPPAG
ncbi:MULTISPECIES: hypothetical protein [unclassified Mycolicibacterium]|uniref:hypothetical protein n=1 Tax=unclassified Mycolicibacterium TaxID=2636767 RepID=UPI0012DCDB44|nr:MULTISPECIES: hypothetical protein [unclassified Mycolicibacterium]